MMDISSFYLKCFYDLTHYKKTCLFFFNLIFFLLLCKQIVSKEEIINKLKLHNNITDRL